MPYAYGGKQDGPSQFDNQFGGPITKLNPLQKLEQDLWNDEAKLDTKCIA